MTTNSENSSKSAKVFFLTKNEYHSVKKSVNFNNFMTVPGVGKEKGGLTFYTMKKEEVSL